MTTLLLALSLACTSDKDTPADDTGDVAVDADGDGYFADEDCDDDDPAINPDAEELCDGVDNDCNDAIDDDASDALTWYTDADGDLVGGDATVLACEAPDGAVADTGDCDDTNAAIFPGQTEICNEGVDDDCNELADDADPDLDLSTATSWYPDGDNDGYGDANANAVQSCEAPSGLIADAQDCDDVDPAINPDASEVCDGLDNDCDGALSAEEIDDDGDGYSECDGDPDDTDPSITPAVSYAVGGQERSWTTTGYFRANIYEAQTATTLLEYEAYLGLGADCNLGWFVFSHASLDGAMTLEWSTQTTEAAGTGHFSSGDIDLTTTAGTFYTLGVGWDCSATYYSSNYGDWDGADAGIGLLAGNASNNSYAWSSTFMPSGTAGTGSANYDQIVWIAP